MSAVCASPAPGVERRLDAVRALQHALYRAAKADPGRRFHALYDKVHRRDVLQRLNGIAVAPRPHRAWRAPVEHRR